MTSHQAFPVSSYVNHEAKIVAPWRTMLSPQPDSEFAGAAHHNPCSGMTAAAPPALAANTAAPASSIPAPHVVVVH